MNPLPAPNKAQRALYRAVALLAFNRITVHRRPEVPAGPILYLGLHRNGAVDGLPYVKAVPGATFLVSAQLQRSALGRFAFPGIPVSREKDRRRGIGADNAASMRLCVDHLLAGGELFVLPEGTSSLGPRHLPFKSGAARIAQAVVENGRALAVVPMAVHYECAWQWQSRVEVVFGEPLHLRPEAPATAAELLARFSAALVDVGVNVESANRLELVERLAYASTLGTGLAYADCLKRFEREISDDVLAGVASLEAAAAAGGGRVLRHQGVPLLPIRNAYAYWLAWIALMPFMLAFAATNLPVLLAGHWASRALPDDRNVVAFWRLAVALPVAAVWCPATAVWLAYAVGADASLLYAAVSMAALRMVYRFRKLSVAVFNSAFAGRLKEPLLALHGKLSRVWP